MESVARNRPDADVDSGDRQRKGFELLYTRAILVLTQAS